MSKRFFLFGERTFETYALERFATIANDIERMSDTEALMYRESFEEFLQKTLAFYNFRTVDISFEEKIVDLIKRGNQKNKRIFVEYSLMVSGDIYNLGLIPHHQSFDIFELPVTLNTNVLSFEIDSRHHNEEFSAEHKKIIKKDYDRVKEFIEDSLYNLNATISYYNIELEKYLIPILANKVRQAQRSYAIREDLNFK